MSIVPRLSVDLDVAHEEVDGYATCGGCTTVWVGHLICHCATCHLTFTAVGGFDLHRRGGACHTPDQLRARGLEPDEHGHWRKPMPPAARERFHGVAR